MREQSTRDERRTTERDDEPRRPRFGRPQQEIVVAAVLLVTFVYLRLQIDDQIRGRRGGAYVDPDFWPGWLLTAAILLSVIYLVQSIVRARRSPHEGAPERVKPAASAPAASEAEPAGAAGELTDDVATTPSTGEGEEHLHAVAISGNTLKLISGFLLLFGYIYLMRPIGFIPATLLFSIAFLLFVGERRWWIVTGFPVVLLAALLFTFTRLLVVPLPRGTGIFLQFSTYFY
jgi:putative tricarboxylic transport membrane protein